MRYRKTCATNEIMDIKFVLSLNRFTHFAFESNWRGKNRKNVNIILNKQIYRAEIPYRSRTLEITSLSFLRSTFVFMCLFSYCIYMCIVELNMKFLELLWKDLYVWIIIGMISDSI